MVRNPRRPSSSREARLSGLASGALTLVLATSLQDQPIPPAWIDALGIQPDEVDRLLRLGLVEESSGGFCLAPRIDRVAVHRTASWLDRRSLHLKLAEACRQPPTRFELAGDHFKAAGRLPDAAQSYLDAGEQACRRHHHRIAMRCLTAGIRLMGASFGDDDVVRAIRGLERCALLAGEAGAAVNQLQEWRFTPVWRERREVQAEISLVLASLLAREGRNVESAQERSQAAELLESFGRHREATTAAVAAAQTLAFTANHLAARATSEIATRAAEAAGDPGLEAQAALIHGLVLGMLGETDKGRAEIERCLELALREHLTALAAEAYHLLGTVAEYASCYDDEADAFATALKFCHRHDQTVTAGMCLGCLSYSLLRSGNWKRSEAVALKVVRDRNVPDLSRSIAECVLGLLHVHRGEIREATKRLHASLERTRVTGMRLMDFYNLFGLALVAEVTGRTAEAASHYLSLLEFWRSTDDRHDAIPSLTAAVSFFVDEGRPDDAAAAAEALESIAAATANPEARGAALLASGEMLCQEGRFEQGVDAMRRALAAFERRPLSIEPIRAGMRLARALLRLEKRDEAHDLLEGCRKKAARLGARMLLARIEVMLDGGTGGDGPFESDAEAGTWDLLSPRQREVARQLARGRTNKEIATQLSVSVRTVDMHVAHILTRLDCRTRAEAAARITMALG